MSKEESELGKADNDAIKEGDVKVAVELADKIGENLVIAENNAPNKEKVENVIKDVDAVKQTLLSSDLKKVKDEVRKVDEDVVGLSEGSVAEDHATLSALNKAEKETATLNKAVMNEDIDKKELIADEQSSDDEIHLKLKIPKKDLKKKKVNIKLSIHESAFESSNMDKDVNIGLTGIQMDKKLEVNGNEIF